MATKDDSPFSARIVGDILRLCDLVRGCHATPDGARWIQNTLRDAAAHRHPPRTASSDSDSSAPGQRRREDPSSGRGDAKRATFPGTSDSDLSAFEVPGKVARLAFPRPLEGSSLRRCPGAEESLSEEAVRGGVAVGSGVPKGVLNPAGAVRGGVAAACEVTEAEDVAHDPSGEGGVVFSCHPVGVRKRGLSPVGV